jgi:prevent-host-death family protein
LKAVSTITVSELKRKPTEQWREAARAGDLVVTEQGEPVAVLVPIDAQSLEPTLSTLRSVRALRAQASLQEAARQNSTHELTTAEIDNEIAASRRARRK